ncbi:MAG: lipopolysaccharide biosynthesis protein, partial [Micromonosporaceae bacterium]|nr:lipopolysaccharide biosynthesis protein [Micromonosporaceae bacterium]
GVAIPLGALALRRAGVILRPIGPALVRPLAATLLATAVALAAAHLAGPHTLAQLAAGGCAGLLAYVPAAVPREQLRQWLGALRRRGTPAEAGALD